MKSSPLWLSPRAPRLAWCCATLLALVAGNAHAEPEPRSALRITSSSEGQFGYRVATLDYNGSGGERRHLAISDPYRSDGNGVVSGFVTVHRYNFLDTTTEKTITLPEPNNAFGAALAVGDFNEDGNDDLLIGAPDQDGGRGGIYWWYDIGNSDSIYPAFENTLGTDGHCGFSLAVGDWNDDSHDDFAAGCPDATVGATPSAGSVVIGYGDGTGNFDIAILSQDSAGVGGGAESGDRFGHSLATGNFDRDFYEDLAIGVPYESVDGAVASGALHVLFGEADVELSGTGSQLIHQGVADVPGVSDDGDHFALTLATGRRSGTFSTRHWLAVGVPDDFENSGGAVLVFNSSSTGLNTTTVEVIAPSDFPPDPAGQAPHAYVDQVTRFGVSLAATPVDGDSDPDLLIGIAGYATTVPFPVQVPGLLCIAYGLDEGATGTGVLDGGQRCYGDRQFGAPAFTGPTFGAASASGRLDGALGRELVIASPGTRQVFVLRNVLFGNGFERPLYP